MLGAAKHRSDAYSKYEERGAQAATTQMGRMGAEDASSRPRSSSLSQRFERDGERLLGVGR
jgi:hypothetical protein